MRKIFVDTSGWANLADARQDFHEETNAIYHLVKQEDSRLITTNYVLTEVIALFTSRLRIPRQRSIDFINGVRNSSLVDIIHIDQGLDERAWKLLSDRIDKTWSLVDCSSFVVMTENSIGEALTTDHHFEQAGFLRLLK